MATTDTDNRSPEGGSASQDPVAPRDDGQQASGGRVEGGGTEGTPPLNFDDDEIYSGRGKAVRTGGTANAPGGDSGRLGPPGEQLSNTNGPSDPDENGSVI